MNCLSISLSCIFLILLSRQALSKICSKKCTDCPKSNLTFFRCPDLEITHLDIELNPKGIVISCSKKFLGNEIDVPSFDASFLSSISDDSPLNLVSLSHKCAKTKLKKIKYLLDFNKLSKVAASKNLLEREVNVISFKLKQNLKDKENLTIVNSDLFAYGSQLKTVVVNGASMPDLQTFFANLTHLEILDLASNHILTIEGGIFKNLTQLRQLNLKDNNISRLSRGTFEGIKNIDHLDLSFNKIEHASKEMFLRMEKIKLLNFSNNSLKSIDSDTFNAFSNLEILDLSNNPSLTSKDLFTNLTTSLKSLSLSGCNFSNPTNLFSNAQNLDFLNLSGNNIKSLDKNAFQNLTKLREVDLSHNDLEVLPADLFWPLKSLEKIFLGFNKLKVFDFDVFWSDHTLETIDLRNNLISEFSHGLNRFNVNNIILKNNRIERFPECLVNSIGLKQLDLSYNKISSVDLVKEVGPKPLYIEIDLKHNQIEQLNITNMENSNISTTLNWKVMMDLSKNRLKCNCLQYKIDEIQQSNTQMAIIELTSKDTICYNEYPIYNCPLISIKNCPVECDCFYSFNETGNIVNVDCSNRQLVEYPKIHDLKAEGYSAPVRTVVKLNNNKLNIKGQEKMKYYNNVSHLDLSRNDIEVIKWIPERIKELILDDNKLTTISEKIINQFRKNRYLKGVSLDKNPWVCDCKAGYLQQYLIEFNNIKVNQSEVLCADTNHPMVYTKICENRVPLIVGASLGVPIILVSILFALYYKNRTSIKIYLYSKNMCLWFVAEEELDKEKIYDVFISYSHKDESFVVDHLLPELENGETQFKVCVHFRDFMPGDLISTQIVNSVLDSRRTLVVLSNSFMESVWGKMEFRTAHQQAIDEGRARVIVVLLGDIDEGTLDEEMKAYIKTNTYVKWGDPWFWNKLKYALPHSKLKKYRRNISENSQESFHLRV